MKILLSPAKSLNFETPLPHSQFTEPVFLNEAARIAKLLKKKSARSLSKLMGISEALGQLNYQRNQDWSLPFTPENARPAVYAFSGDVYRGLDVYTLPPEKISFLQDSVRILSGMYGILKPLDLIQAYRLEMGTKFAVGVKKNLYEFWREKLTTHMNAVLQPNEMIINLASAEYFKALPFKALNVPVYTPVFKDYKNGTYKTIMTFAKLARGYMTRYLVENEVNTEAGVKAFQEEGYAFSESLSTNTEWVFTR